jgi:type IV pilus assembly protein PilQ
MRKWTKTAGLLFVAASAVLPNGAALAQATNGATTAAPTTAPADSNDPFATAPTSQPSDKGQSVSDAQVNVTEEGTVEIHVNDANLNEVLRMLSLQLEKNILPSKEVRGTVTANLYDVTVREALDAILKANGFDYREKGNVIYVYTAKEIQDMEKAARVTKTEVFRLYYTPAANASVMIKPVLSTEAQVALTTPAQAGISSDGGDTGGNNHATEDILVVTDYPERLDQVRRILKEVDRKPQQVLVEATILRASLQDDNALGVDFNVLGGLDFNTITGTESAGQITSAGVGPGDSGKVEGDSRIHSVGTGNNFAGPINGGLKVGVVSQNISVFVAALEGVTDTSVVANPKVLVLNKQRGSVHVGSEIGYRTAITTETATADNVKFLETGTVLNFRPYVGDNGNIRLEIAPEDSSGSVNSAGLPNKFVTKVTSNVMVKDGHTIVIGGLFREATTRSRSQIPGLGSLPIVGTLFGKQTDQTIREEVIILLTPHLIKDDEAYSQVSEEEARNAERIRVGMRHGMMWFGRERLAEGHYKSAVKDHQHGHDGSALWHLNAALGLNPKMPEAMDLKARIQGKEVTGVDGSSIHNFVRRAILADRATTQPANGMTSAQEYEALPAPESSAQATQEPAAEEPVAQEPVAQEPVQTPAEPTREATVPTGDATEPGPVSQGRQNRKSVQQPAPRQPEFANTPGNEPAVNGGENATTETSETPVEPIEGEFTPE